MAVGDVLHKEVVLSATPDRLWAMWTSAEGLKWISSQSRVDAVPGGEYSWFLDIVDENGRRGGEGSRLIALTPPNELVFTWTFPPSIPSLRSAVETTTVTVRFDPVGGDRTRVTLDAVGWQDGEDWEAGYAYFDRAWDVVFDRMVQALEGSAGAGVKPPN